MPEEKTDVKPVYGGQAVIEGVMMRGPRFFAIACRRENKEIVIKQECIETTFGKLQWMNKPFLRGTLAMIDAMVLGIKALTYSADIAMSDVQANGGEEVKPEKSKPKKIETEESKQKKAKGINDITIGVTMVLGVALALAIFIGIPQLFIQPFVKKAAHSLLWSILLNAMAGGIKLVLFVGYIFLISRMNDVKRVFQYHGAEHKVINTFEAGKELNSENFSMQTTIHPRCGTSFLLVVILVSTIVFCLLPLTTNFLIRLAERLILLPLVAGISYEVIRFAGKHRDSKIMRAILAPGLWMQTLTTNEPTEDMVEVAYCALKAVMDKEHEAKESPEAATCRD